MKNLCLKFSRNGIGLYGFPNFAEVYLNLTAPPHILPDGISRSSEEIDIRGRKTEAPNRPFP